MKRTVHQVELTAPEHTSSAQLAAWARTALAAAGLSCGEAVDEDWGALVSVEGPGRVIVCCTVHDEDDESVESVESDGAAAAITVEDVPRRLRKPDPEAAALVEATVAALAAALPPDATWTQGGPASS